MSGALAERVFAHKIEKVGFADLGVVARQRFGIDDVAAYPLFTPDLVGLMRDLIPAERHDEVATSITLVAYKPAMADAGIATARRAGAGRR